LIAVMDLRDNTKDPSASNCEDLRTLFIILPLYPSLYNNKTDSNS